MKKGFTQKSILIFLIFTLSSIKLLSQYYTVIEYLKKGNAKINSGDYRGAIQDYNKALELNPNSDDAYNNRGVAKNELGDFRGAIQDFNKALELNPNFPKVYNN
ncbi:MAG: tetratricopeptide repeat protein, partial [Bacteroidetes bacterium]|nr:tetratricopeptide repeat protein [Bacteroidota bacterium]